MKVVGSIKVAGLLEGEIINAETVLEIVQHQRRLDNYEWDYAVFINGVSVGDEMKNLSDYDEVILVPIAIGG